MKKRLMSALAAVIIIQLLLPAYMIANKYDTLRTGTEYKFIVHPVDPYDAFRGRYVNINVVQDVQGSGKYGTIKVDEYGYAYIDKVVDEIPRAEDYVRNGGRYGFAVPIDRYYMEEKLAPMAEELVQNRDPDNFTYAAARVKNGNLVVSGLFIDGVAIEDIIRGYN